MPGNIYTYITKACLAIMRVKRILLFEALAGPEVSEVSNYNE
jgi:hypothetical protein